ncbi:hypothetical protein ACFYKT_18200 [Cytobacillus sp. FJAT-53684]|uniref:Uncharacterized protein n=1 Tax=Cytobacillus mangrovibacter TaxID=3299024 RepID=A0ABW6K5X5_9BACI
MKPLKTKANEWIYLLYDQCSINDKEKIIMDCPLYFKLEGFADEPVVYIRATHEGLEFGFEATKWLDGHTPFPYMYKKHTLKWADLEKLSKGEQQEAILNLLMKTISSRKRQYWKCQYCGGKIAIEHRFDPNTCHGCASENFGVIY